MQASIPVPKRKVHIKGYVSGFRVATSVARGVAILEAKERFGIEGVTYSGGEPTCQQNLPLLTKEIKSLGLGVISFTGRTYEDVSEFFEGCDVVLDGSFKEYLPETKRRLLGSENQRIICLTERYKDCIDSWFADHNKVVEVSVGSKIIANGDKF